MVTYVNDLRLSELATGEGSGTWGTTTNTNLELIGEALGYSTEAITTNADTHATTVADGSTDPGRAMYIKYTGTLDSACTITIGPNTLSRVHIIENATSGSQNIIIKQGSGAEITIPNGFVKAVYLDGAGSGAAVIEAFADLSIGPNLRIGNAAAEDTAIVFDGNAQDFYIGLDDSADDLIIGLGSTVGTTPIISVDENKDVAIPDGGLTITTSDNTTQLTLKSTDADANTGPVLNLQRDSGSPADDDFIGNIKFQADNDAGEVLDHVSMLGQILDASDGTEDSSLQIYTLAAGASTKTLSLESGRVLIGTDSGDGFNSDSMLRLQRTGDRVFIQFKTDADQTSGILFGDVDDDVECAIEYEPANKALTFSTSNNNEAGRFDSSQRLLIGSTTAQSVTGGARQFEIQGTSGVTASMAIIRHSNSSGGPTISLGKSRATSTGGVTIAADGDVIGELRFVAADGVDLDGVSANIKATVDGTPGTNDVPGRLSFWTTADGAAAETQRMYIDAGGHVVINPQTGGNIASLLDGNLNIVSTEGAGNHSDALRIFYEHASTSGGLEARIKWYTGDDGTAHSYGNSGYIAIGKEGSYVTDDTRDSYMSFATQLNASLSEKGRITANGDHLFNRTSASFNNDGLVLGNSTGAYIYCERSIAGNSLLYLHRRANDGELVSFYSQNAQEGNISVSGSTVSYNGFSGTHDSSGSGVSSSTAVGTVLSTIDEEHKTDHAKVKVSDTASDKRVYGVLQTYKAAETNDTGNTVAEHAIVASVGIASVRVTGACAGGDLLESAGDGTARVQSDDIIRSSTLGKVTIGNSNTGEKMVSCVMYCG